VSTVTLKIKAIKFNATMTYDIKDAEPRSTSHYRQGRLYRPDYARLNYSRMDGEAWQFDGGRLEGWVLKKDGTPSLNNHREPLWRTVSENWPMWVKVAVGNAPEVTEDTRAREAEPCEHLHQAAEMDDWICTDCGVICEDDDPTERDDAAREDDAIDRADTERKERDR